MDDLLSGIWNLEFGIKSHDSLHPKANPRSRFPDGGVSHPHAAKRTVANIHVMDLPIPRQVLVSSGLATLLGLATGIAVTRSRGRDFLPAVSALASMGQTFPPVAVLAISVPVVGFGFKPTIIALFLYGLLPIVRNTITGIDSVAADVLEAAGGMGMTPFQVLRFVEIPLAMPVILAGIRISTVINMGTATLGATIGAGGLGKPIIAGLIGENPAFILEGAILVGLFAIIVDTALGMLGGNSVIGD
jgi:osmoprotectant transport system permease protein